MSANERTGTHIPQIGLQADLSAFAPLRSCFEAGGLMQTTAAIYTDFTGLTELKARAGRDADGSLKEVARQFESLLLGQMLKSMRQASLGEGLLDSEQSLFYRDMYDKQLALHLTRSGGLGLAAMIERQLGGGRDREATGRAVGEYRQRPLPPPPIRSAGGAVPNDAPAAVQEVTPPSGATVGDDPATWQPEEFVARLMPWAREAGRKLGLAPEALLAQAALESGWGRHMIRDERGVPANNLFGIKADRRWQGKRVGVETLEYRDGLPRRTRASFRAYASYRESFDDYVAFLRSSPRYREALASAPDPDRYFSALQQAGYATDPRYAEKIDALLNGPEMQRALKSARRRPL